MKDRLKNEIQNRMVMFLDNTQMQQLSKVLAYCLNEIEIIEVENAKISIISDENSNLLQKFISSKRVEGCSEKSLKYYDSTINRMLKKINKDIKCIITDDLRDYLGGYQKEKCSSKVTIDNIRRILSSFFSWLEDEDYILKSPVRRIHKIKAKKIIQEIFTDEGLELLRDNCDELRDLAMVDLLASTGMRVGELILLNIDDINFNERECIVFGKGSREREVYFDARTKIHLRNYINSREEDNTALFVSLSKPHKRLKICGVELRL